MIQHVVPGRCLKYATKEISPILVLLPMPIILIITVIQEAKAMTLLEAWILGISFGGMMNLFATGMLVFIVCEGGLTRDPLRKLPAKYLFTAGKLALFVTYVISLYEIPMVIKAVTITSVFACLSSMLAYHVWAEVSHHSDGKNGNASANP